MYGYFMQNNAKAHTAYFSMTECIWQTGDNLWTVASYSSRFESVCLLLEGVLNDRVYMHNPHSLQELYVNMCRDSDYVSK